MKYLFNISLFLVIFKINAIIVSRTLLEDRNMFNKLIVKTCDSFNSFMSLKKAYFKGDLSSKNIPDSDNMYIYFQISINGIESGYHINENGEIPAIFFFKFKYHTNEVNQIDPVSDIQLSYSDCENNKLVLLNNNQEKALFNLENIKFYIYKNQNDPVRESETDNNLLKKFQQLPTPLIPDNLKLPSHSLTPNKPPSHKDFDNLVITHF